MDGSPCQPGGLIPKPVGGVSSPWPYPLERVTSRPRGQLSGPRDLKPMVSHGCVALYVGHDALRTCIPLLKVTFKKREQDISRDTVFRGKRTRGRSLRGSRDAVRHVERPSVRCIFSAWPCGRAVWDASDARNLCAATADRVQRDIEGVCV